jgi:hypothetical protein
MSRYSPLVLAAGCLALPWLAHAAKGEEKCTIATKGDNPVVLACQKGGIKQAKQAMKELTAKAKDKGMKKVACDDCHKDPGKPDLTLKPDAQDRFAEMLKLVGGAAAK